MDVGITYRLHNLDWHKIESSLGQFGFAVTPAVLTEPECRSLIELYSGDRGFRSHIVMARYRFGRGDYKYFDYPLPPLVQQLREHSYAHLSAIANEWNRQMGAAQSFPPKHGAFLKVCKDHGQERATPLLLHYEAGDFNCLHQDIYGEVAFPLQLTCFLSETGTDYEGGEFVLTEQQPRAQSRAEVIAPKQGQILIFATRYRPVRGARGYYRVNLRHGVSRIRQGTRFTLGVIFHDAQ